MVQIHPGVSATLAQAEGRVARMEARAETVVDEIVEDGELTTISESEPAGTEETPGVLRLLQAGHFRGVADVRLRIVHADKIRALEFEQARVDVADSSDILTSSLSSTVAELAEASDTVSVEEANAAVVAFDDQVSAAIDTLFSSDDLDVSLFEITLQEAFQSLVDQLGLGSPADDLTTEATEIPVSNNTIAYESDAGDRDFLVELNEIFSAALAKILAGLENEITLPPISEPNGNGRAFEKFLAIYNEIQYGGDVVDVSPEIEINA